MKLYMCKKREERVRYYRFFDDDFVQTPDQSKQLDKEYCFVHGNLFFRASSFLVYHALMAVSFCYCRCFLHLKVVNRARFPKGRKEGYFVYANHTQPFGDVVMPCMENPSWRKYWVGSSANLGIPVIGRLLKMGGLIPIPSRIKQMKAFTDAIFTRVDQGCAIYIYPEAHVWPWYTGIRPFSSVSFTYPVEKDAPVYVATTTYQRRGRGKRAGVTVFLDGPMEDDKSLTRKERKEALCKQVYACMLRTARKESTYMYVTYRKEE